MLFLILCPLAGVFGCLVGVCPFVEALRLYRSFNAFTASVFLLLITSA